MVTQDVLTITDHRFETERRRFRLHETERTTQTGKQFDPGDRGEWFTREEEEEEEERIRKRIRERQRCYCHG